MRFHEFSKSSIKESNVDANNAEYNKTNYQKPKDDTLYGDDTYGDSLSYQNYSSRMRTAQNNKINNASRNAAYNADMSAQSQHTAPVNASQEQWNDWIRDGGLDYARKMDLGLQTDIRANNGSVDYAERQAYIRSQNRLAQS